MNVETVAKTELEERLRSLEEEYEMGQRMLREAELQRIHLEQTLVRIDGAMTLLRELLGTENGGAPSDRAEEPA
jgi:hypothetical protein